MQRFAHDVRHGVRLLWNAPGFALAAVIALALGIGAATAIFSVVDAVLLRPLPFRDPDRLMILWEKNPASHKYKLFVSPADFLEWRAQSHAFEALAAVQDTRMNLTGGPSGAIDPEEIAVERVSASLFPLLGVQPVLGRAFRPEEDRPGAADVVLLSHRLWLRRFGADRGIVGKSIRLRDRSYTITGVLPAGFALLDPGVEAWLPLALAPGDPRAASARNLMVVGRLAPGASAAQAPSEMEAIGARLERARPATNSGWRPSLFELREEMTGSVRSALLVLLGAVGLLLLIACANVANLLLARAGSRQKEIAIRAALGAGRTRIVLQLVTESVILALAGGMTGLLLAWTGIRALLSLAPTGIPRLAGAGVDLRALGFALACSVATGVIFGLAPAVQASRTDLHESLKEGGRSGTAGRGRRRLRDALVVAEVAIAVVVLVGAGLLMRSFLRLREADPGFAAEGLLTMRIPLAGGRNAAEARRVAFFQEIVARTASLAGVRAAGAVNSLPLTGLGIGTTFTVEGAPAVAADEKPMCLVRPATPGYLQTMGIRLLAGRDFGPFDAKDSTPVAIVNSTMARRHLPGRNPVGARILLDAPPRMVEVVGVSGDVKPDRLEGSDWPTVYLPYPQAPAVSMSLAVRTTGDPALVANAVTREIRRLDPDQPVADVRSMERVVGEAIAGPKFNAWLMAVFAGMAFALAAVGIYGVISYTVTERTREFGIRLALGASRSDIFRLVLLEGARLAGAGLAIGLAASYWVARLLSSLLYAVRPNDLATFAAIALLLGVVALAASWLPSLRATTVDPIGALRHE